MKYARRSGYGIIVDGVEVNQSMYGYLNGLCVAYFSTYEGRIQAVRKILNRKRSVPLFVSPEVVLFGSSNIKEYGCVFINYRRVIKIQKQGENSVILFDDFSEIMIENRHRNICKNYRLTSDFLKIYEQKESVYNKDILIDFLN
jgi:competence protein ComK